MQVDDPHESCVELLLLSATELPHGAQATLAGFSFVSSHHIIGDLSMVITVPMETVASYSLLLRISVVLLPFAQALLNRRTHLHSNALASTRKVSVGADS
jgi:hypothetical protein